LEESACRWGIDCCCGERCDVQADTPVNSCGIWDRS
jgi:hypothetical protein